MTTFAEAIGWLKARGIDAGPARKGHGIEGNWNDGRRNYAYQIDLNFDAGFEMSVVPEPGPTTWWIHAQTLDEILQMLVDAQSEVDSGRASSWLEALKVRDPIRWMDPDHKFDTQ